MFRFFENLVDPYVAYEEKDAPPRRLLAFLRDYARPFRKVFAAAIAVKVVTALTEVGLLWYMGRIVDFLAGEEPRAALAAHWMELTAAAVFVLVLRPFIAGLDVALLHNTIVPNLRTLVSWRAHRHILRQPVGWFENDFAGRIANRVMQTPPATSDAVFQLLDALAFAFTTFLGSVALLSAVDARLMVPLVVWFLGYVLLLRVSVSRVAPAAQAASGARSAVTGRIVDSYANIHSVKLFAHDDREIAYAGEAIENARIALQREMRIITRMDILLTALNGALIVGLSALAVWLWYAGTASIGIVAVATAMALRLNNMTYWIMWASTALVQALGTVAEGMETIAQPIGLVDRAGARALDLREGRIEIQGLSHHYGRGSGGLAAIDLTIRPGEKVGIVGRSGAGKSTLVKLLLRFYDAEAGTIRIDGQDIACLTQASLRRHIGMVQQETSLLHRSVRDNILYGRPEATEAEMIEAAKRAEAHEFIEALRDPAGHGGYDAQVGERGVKLSGGQRQRIALARVILKDAPILVLDEATSALDSEVEAAIQNTLYGVMEGKTVIAIAHRLSTIARMDRIVVLEDGRVAEEGSHAQLLAMKGLYARFWDRQSGGFIGLDDHNEGTAG
ncbi:ABC transporter ATP-binding protein [Albidovulum sediminicola]|uniref:ABC transporter ATP-binding protein/permease n=1 Tax=Albidovulum sediminicola TaxID=2984331 RepID=A0ABT2YWG0_9RHOB|nr:ABC transporter ATP-binding protein [Defluviimonas sp. WL0075]MCV2863216.1 ABC transporter ATP-binding protein/permease [Defluviimonas sp. WL0075]